MTINDFDRWAQSIMPIAQFKKTDASLNGLQVGKMDQKLERISFALDACAASIAQAAAQKADMLFVHHGLFWGPAVPIEGILYAQIQQLMQHNIALYAVHLPLDAVPEFGNNARVAKILNLQNCEVFSDIGFVGDLPSAMSTQEIAQKVFAPHQPLIWDNCPSVKRVAVMVGGGARFAQKAAAAKADCYITGEPLHQVFHFCQESGLSFIAGGHYYSEMIGLQSFKEQVEQKFPPVQTYWIDIPTGV